MSIFASYVTRTVELPFDEPHTVTIQKLSGKALAAARQARVAASMDLVKTMGGAAFGRELAQLTTANDGLAAAIEQETTANQTDPVRLYDRSTVLAKGVKAWTYSEAIAPDRLDDLDEQAADFLFRAILDLTLPNGAAEKKTDS
jgi:hypothetical protein